MKVVDPVLFGWGQRAGRTGGRKRGRALAPSVGSKRISAGGLIEEDQAATS